MLVSALPGPGRGCRRRWRKGACHEGSSERPADLRGLQNGPPQGTHLRHLFTQPPPQAAAGV